MDIHEAFKIEGIKGPVTIELTDLDFDKIKADMSIAIPEGHEIRRENKSPIGENLYFTRYGLKLIFKKKDTLTRSEKEVRVEYLKKEITRIREEIIQADPTFKFNE